jgi:ATP-dependent helicase/nuclease subunit B
VEQPFELELEGWTIRGKIDRIDRHPDGRVRLLDYKTSDKAEPPDRAHWKPLRSQADPAKTVPEAEAEIAGKAGLWRNLQLPLYFHHWCRENPADRARLQCGYIQLPEAVQDVSFALWDTFDAATEQSAVRCAARVLEAIDGGRFWPPLESGVWNRAPWNLWLPGGPQKCVEEAVP